MSLLPVTSGYMPCACRDCFETAIGAYANAPHVLCLGCEEAGCSCETDDPRAECRNPAAYGGSEEEESP